MTLNCPEGLEHWSTISPNHRFCQYIWPDCFHPTETRWKTALHFTDICHFVSVSELQPPQNTVYVNLWKCQANLFSQHKSLLQICVHLKSDCRQLSTASPYGPCIYGVMRPAPGVQSGHYLGDAPAPVVKVIWYTPDVLTLDEYWRILNV